jgi:diguanylate cyclase (GGDEF)-like protein
VPRVFSADSGVGTKWWLSHHFPIPDTQGTIAWVGTVAIDITEQKAQEEKIARLSRIQAVLSGINSAIVRIRSRQKLFDEACRIAVDHGNFGLAWIGTYDPQTLDVTPVAYAGLGTDELKHSKATTREDVAAGQGVLGRAIRERRSVFDNELSAQGGVSGKRRQAALELGYRSLIVMPLFEQQAVVGCLGLYTKEPDFFTEEELKILSELAGDISFALEHIAKEEKLNYLAYYDVLSGLPNRTLFLDRLAHELQSAKQHGTSVALVLGDIKRLRFVNESFGRQTGDALLREMAARWKGVWPDSENVGRIAADCLAGIVGNIKEPADVAHLLEGPVNESFRAALSINGNELAASLTMGVAIFPTDGMDAEALLRNADSALNKAKKHSEHYAFYQAEMNATIAESLLLENKLRRALEKQQFVLHYQPKVNLATGEVTSMEALIRWNDGSRLVPPGQFVPLLEDTGMILEVGQWAMREALADRRRWQARGLRPPRIAVNVSAVQLRQGNFVDMVREAIADEQDGSHGLDLEITESMIMDDIEGNIAKLRALRDLGFNVAIDDFGTGYSSLGYLAKLPVNALKIDRSFVAAMGDNADGMSIVSTIISLAHSLNLKVIGEGVEIPEQRQLLTLLKCDEIQGYLVSQPLPCSEIETFFNRQ